jgi:N-acylneuraminate cytidylyltransferase/CMP-N,N'-diacetyllegionaminic acid synthase
MGKKMKRLCTICARGGSKGVKNKNIRDLGGKPLIAHSLGQAKESGLFNKVVVSSDSDEILAVAKKWGADLTVKRPAKFASDTAPKLSAIKHCVEQTERICNEQYDTIVDLDATSPLRSVKDIQEAVRLLESKKVANVITGAPARRSPYFNLVERDEKGVVHLSKQPPVPIVRRQDAPRCFDMNASIYVWRRDSFFQSNQLFLGDTLLYEMPEERSHDIDSERDFQIVEFLWRQRNA